MSIYGIVTCVSDHSRDRAVCKHPIEKRCEALAGPYCMHCGQRFRPEAPLIRVNNTPEQAPSGTEETKS